MITRVVILKVVYHKINLKNIKFSLSMKHVVLVMCI